MKAIKVSVYTGKRMKKLVDLEVLGTISAEQIELLSGNTLKAGDQIFKKYLGRTEVYTKGKDNLWIRTDVAYKTDELGVFEIDLEEEGYEDPGF